MGPVASQISIAEGLVTFTYITSYTGGDVACKTRRLNRSMHSSGWESVQHYSLYHGSALRALLANEQWLLREKYFQLPVQELRFFMKSFRRQFSLLAWYLGNTYYACEGGKVVGNFPISSHWIRPWFKMKQGVGNSFKKWDGSFWWWSWNREGRAQGALLRKRASHLQDIVTVRPLRDISHDPIVNENGFLYKWSLRRRTVDDGKLVHILFCVICSNILKRRACPFRTFRKDTLNRRK